MYASVMLFLFLLSGCHGIPDQNTSSIPQVTISVDSENETIPPERSVDCQLIPKTVENPDGFPVLRWVCLVDDATLYDASTKLWTAEVGNEINQTLAERKLPFRLQIVLLTAKGYFYDWLGDPTVAEYLADADLVYGFFYPDQAAGIYQPITEYVIGENAPLRHSVADDIYWKTDMFGGEVYGIQGTISYPLSLGWICDESLMANLDLSYEDLSKNYWQMDALFSEIYKANNQQPFLFINETGVITNDMVMTCLPASLSDQLFYRYQWVTSCYGIEYSLDVPTVVCSLDTDYTRNLVTSIQRYMASGYTFTDGKEGRGLIEYGSIRAHTPHTLDGICYLPVEQSQYMTVYGNFLNGVAKDSKQKDHAVVLLELIANDEKFRRLLCFGRNGTEYVVQDGTVTFHDSTSYYNMRFLSGLSDFSGLDTGVDFLQIEGETALETYQNMMNNAVKWCPLLVGCGFDISGITTEIDTVNRILENNADNIIRMNPEEYDQFTESIRTAGGDKIQAELQRQLDAWLAENPDWNK